MNNENQNQRLPNIQSIGENSSPNIPSNGEFLGIGGVVTESHIQRHQPLSPRRRMNIKSPKKSATPDTGHGSKSSTTDTEGSTQLGSLSLQESEHEESSQQFTVRISLTLYTSKLVL